MHINYLGSCIFHIMFLLGHFQGSWDKSEKVVGKDWEIRTIEPRSQEMHTICLNFGWHRNFGCTGTIHKWRHQFFWKYFPRLGPWHHFSGSAQANKSVLWSCFVVVLSRFKFQMVVHLGPHYVNTGCGVFKQGGYKLKNNFLWLCWFLGKKPF